MDFIRRLLLSPQSAESSILEDLVAATRSGNSPKITEILRRHPAFITYEGPNGENLLHIAAESQKLSSVSALIDAGVDAKKKTSKGWTPEDYACFAGEFRMGCYTEICMKIRKRLTKPRQLMQNK